VDAWWRWWPSTSRRGDRRLPRTLAGKHGAAAEITTEFAGQLAETADMPVCV